jgi:hypothetical protein
MATAAARILFGLGLLCLTFDALADAENATGKSIAFNFSQKGRIT